MMISHSKSAVLCLVALSIILAISNVIPAQQTPPESAAADAEKDKERQELEKKTVALLNDIASAAWSLKLPENRFFVISSTADLLWTFDEKRARTLYWEALNSLNSIPPPVRSTGERLSKGEREKLREPYQLMFRLRQQLLRQLAQRDSQLALDMLRATRPVLPRELGDEFSFFNDNRVEQDIAIDIAARDPAQALQVARESLANGFSFRLLKLLQRLNQMDSEKASEFASDVIDKLRTTNINTELVASVIAAQLLLTSRTSDSDRAMLASPNGSAKPLSLNDEQKRQLVEILTDAALSTSANTSLRFDIPELMPEIEQFFPERRVALERKLAAFNEALPKRERNQGIYSNLIRRGMPEEIVRLAATSNDADRFRLYQQAAIIAAFRGPTDSFRDMVSKDVKDQGDQRRILDSLDTEEIGVAAYRKQIDQLRTLLPKIRRKEERARAMAELALMLKEKGEDAEASTLLDEAATLIKTDLKSETQSNALLTLLCAYAVVDPPKAFAIAERTIDQANDQISLLMLVDKVVKSGSVKKSEIILDQGGIMPLESIVFRFGKGVAALAKSDFNRTRGLADRFERNELRVMARLLIAKGILTSKTSPRWRGINVEL